MPDKVTQEKRDAWRSRFDQRAPLAGQLDSPDLATSEGAARILSS